jgi:hypothetical protein
VRKLLKGFKDFQSIENFVSYKTILKDIRKIADQHGFYIIAKTRIKHKDPYFVNHYVDQFFYDGDFYPFRTLELLYASDYYIGFPSASIFESVYLGKYSITIIPYPNSWYENPSVLYIRKNINERYLWQTEGVSKSFRVYQNGEYDNFLEELKNLPSIKVDEKKQNFLIKKIIGPADGKTSQRFLDLIMA